MVLRCAIVAACVITSACHREPRVDASERARALEGIAHLRAQFNTGNCEMVYEDASSRFRTQNSVDWRRECALMKDDFGAWTGFEFEYAEKWMERDPLIVITGRALFAKQTKTIAVAWTVDGHLAHIAVQEDERHWKNFPDRGSLGIQGPWIDPPLRPKEKLSS